MECAETTPSRLFFELMDDNKNDVLEVCKKCHEETDD